MKTIYENIVVTPSIFPVDDTTNTTPVNGVSVDTVGYNSGMLVAKSSVASQGTASLLFKLQESADGSTNWTDALDNTGTVIGGTLVATSAAGQISARVEGLNGLNRKRYLRAVLVPTLAGSANVVVSADIVLGRVYEAPANATVSNT